MPHRTPRRSAVAAALLGAAGAAALPLLGRAAVRAQLDRKLAALKAGDVAPLVALYAPGARLTFPGEHSWGRTYTGRAEIEGFLRRFVAARLTGEIADVLVQGPPWRTMLAVRFDDESRDADGTLAYTNRAVLWARLRWGRIVEEEVFEDTQKVAAFDEHLAARRERVPA